jgi:WhiB family transcriptional regulator, redox-sensing transcriptional regulator
VATDWRHRAKCRTDKCDPELFFVAGRENSQAALLQIKEAKRVCQGCPVKSNCLQWALGTGQEHGVMGGMSAEERRALLRKARRLAPEDADRSEIAELAASL